MSVRRKIAETGKVPVDCPQCGFQQLESVYAQNTICQKCLFQIDLSKPEKSVKATEGSSLLSRLGGSLGGIMKSERDVPVRCYKCGTGQTVSSAAQSTFCKKCTEYIDLRDHRITGTFSRNIETQGSIIVTTKGDLGSARASCRAATVHGKLRGNLYCTGTAEFKLKGRINGAIDAEHLVVGPRSDIEFVRPIKVRTAEISGKTYGRITAENVVTITKSGWLEGVVYARSINVERGGVFSGELFIGRQSEEQPELLPTDETGEIFGGEAGLASA